MKKIITSVRCEVLGNHAHVTVWSRGAKCGVLVVAADDGVPLCCRLVPRGVDHLDAVGRFSRNAIAQATVKVDGIKLTATQDDDGPTVAHIEVDGEAMGPCSWNGLAFGGFPKFTLNADRQERGYAALCQAYVDAFADHEAHL